MVGNPVLGTGECPESAFAWFSVPSSEIFLALVIVFLLAANAAHAPTEEMVRYRTV
jgi:hypothetical protein